MPMLMTCWKPSKTKSQPLHSPQRLGSLLGAFLADCPKQLPSRDLRLIDWFLMKHLLFIFVAVSSMLAQISTPLPKPGQPENAAPAQHAAAPEDPASAKQARAVLDQMIAPFVRYWKWPDRDRMEMWRQRNWIVVYNGNDGNETTFHGTRRIDPKDLKAYLERRSYSLDM